MRTLFNHTLTILAKETQFMKLKSILTATTLVAITLTVSTVWAQ